MEYYSQPLPFVFLFVFVSWNSCPHYHLLVAYATPIKEAENPANATKKKRPKILIYSAYWVKA